MRYQHDFFVSLNDAIKPTLLRLVPCLLPIGRKEGNEWVALNPTRDYRNFGSFRVNLITGQWADFATDARGGDVISLYAYLNNCSQFSAARGLMDHLELVCD